MQLTSSNKFVFLVGAGFSTEFGPPVMRDFMRTARENYCTVQADPALSFLQSAYSLMLEFQQLCIRQSAWFNRDWENIEHVYTQADLLRLANASSEMDTKCRAIAWTIWDVYRKCSKLKPGSPVNAHLRSILNQVVESRLKPILITTNYDLFVEKSLTVTKLRKERPWRYYYPGFTWPRNGVGYLMPSSQREYPPHREALPIIKLHGSANWFDCGSTGKWIGTTPWLATTATGTAVGRIKSVDDPNTGPDQIEDQLLREVERVLPETAKDNDDLWFKIATPAIIPPMLGKAFVSEVISSQWRAAMDALGSARELWIIGYSFPETDAFMPRLLSQGLESNQALERIVILNREKKEGWTERLNRLFTPSVIDTKIIYVSIPTSRALKVIAGASKRSDWMEILRDNSDR